MRAEFSVTDDDIAYAEGVLLPRGELFDEERRSFIRDLGTLDLQAVPGSGKTTALLAKLLILDRYLPFADGSGILVLSHTNAAIDEIRSRIGAQCKALFRYPNFVGTIQSFVDEFLAIPYFTNRYKRPPIRIDDEIREQMFANLPRGMKGFSPAESKRALHFLIANKKPLRWSLVAGNMHLTDGFMGSAIVFKKPPGKTRPENYTDWDEDEKARVAEWVAKFALRVLASGHLCYDDAYFLADIFLSKNPHIKGLLQARFSHVFVDEMQDMAKHQHDLLEHVFFDGGGEILVFQRLGDKNQSIYDGRSSASQGFWKDRSRVLQLNGSYRLSSLLAQLVTPFAVSPLRIEGRGKNPDGSNISIRPKFIVYSDTTMEQVILQFTSIVRAELDSGTIPESPRNKYKAVAWAAKPDNGKVRLSNYHPGFSRVEQQQRPDYPNLHDYLLSYDKRDRTFSSVERGITGAILRVLRIEGLTDETGLFLNKTRLKAFLVGENPENWRMHEAKVYLWCLKALAGKEDEVVSEIREYLPDFLALFGAAVRVSAGFINDASGVGTSVSITVRREAPANVFKGHGIEVLVSTVHAVKGETHAATLYMETYYERGGGGNYESERLANQLKGEPVAQNAHDLVKQSAKMVYVGFSRPTHLLCFAVHESRFAALAAEIDASVWDIVWLVGETSKFERAA